MGEKGVLQRERGRASVNETGWGLVVGECSERMSAKPGIPLIQGPQSETVKEPHTMHGCAIVTATPPSNSSSRGWKDESKGHKGQIQLF